MKVLLNVLWYFPFFGFLWGISAGLLGLLLCITIVGIPLGLGLLQFAKFLFMPFTHQMVDKKIIYAATGRQTNQAYQVYATIVRILYFPFGLLNFIGAALAGVAYCFTIIGIPMGIVLFRSLATYFNPVNKICISQDDYKHIMAVANDPVMKEEIMAEMAEKERRREERQDAMIAEFKGNVINVKNKVWPYRWYLAGAIVLVVILSIVKHYTSNEYRYEKGWEAKVEGRADDAVGYFKKISPSDDIHYCTAHTYVFDYYRMSDPSKAGAAIKDAYEKISKSGTYYIGSDDVIERYAEALITGDYEPSVAKNIDEGVRVALTMRAPTQRMVGILFAHGQYDAVKTLSDIFVEKGAYDNRNINIIYGYRGMLYLYGLGSTPRDFKEAAKNLYCVNHCPLFGLPCGDVALLSSGYGLNIGTIENIYDMYSVANVLQWDDATDLMLKKRVETIGNLINAYDEYDYDGWGTPPLYWGTYYVGYYEGYYVGVVGRNNLDETAAGYGAYSWLKKNNENLNYADQMIVGKFDKGRYLNEMLFMFRTEGGMQSVFYDYSGEERITEGGIMYNGDILIDGKTYEFDPSLYAPRLYSITRGEQKRYANEFRKIVIEEPWEWEAFEEY